MFTNNQRQEERTGRYGTPRLQYLQSKLCSNHVVGIGEPVSDYGRRRYVLQVDCFQGMFNDFGSASKEKVVANLANFAYDPYNYSFLRQLNVLELFLDCLTEANEKLIEFGIGGICNACADPANAAIVTQCGGIPLIIQCLSSPVRNTVIRALGTLYYLCNKSNKEEILKPEVVDVIRRYAAADTVSVSFSNLAKAFLDKHLVENE